MAEWAVTTANDKLEFDTDNNGNNSCYQIDSNHFINFWAGYGLDGFVQVFTVNTSTWAVTTANDKLEFDTDNNSNNSCYQIDSNHFINFCKGTDSDGFVQAFTVNTSTWAVTTANDKLEFDTDKAYYNSCYQIDSNHFINFWAGTDFDGFVEVFTVNTSTWAVTTANDKLEFDTDNNGNNSCYQIDSNHFINFWAGYDLDGFVQVFTVNTSTWAVTTANDRLEFNTTYGSNNSCYQIDSNHFINFCKGTDFDGFVQVFTVNTSTWAVTTATAGFEFDTNNSSDHSCYQIDSNHFINFWTGADSDGFVQAFTVNTSTWAVTTANDKLEFDTNNDYYNSCYQIDSNHFINFWAGYDLDGFVQVFEVEIAGSPESESESPSSSPSTSESSSPSTSESSSPSMSESSSPSVSESSSPSTSESTSPSESPSTSESASPSVSESISPSVSESASPSVSESASPSVSESSSPSTSESVSPSVSPSESESSSPSVSESSSPSESESASPSVSESASPSESESSSPSVSESSSPSSSESSSPSVSESSSPSTSESASPSSSPSASPSPGYQGYTKGDEANLPTGILDLETEYSEQNLTDVATKDDTRVGQTATSEYTIHQFKDYAGANTMATLEWEGQTNCPPSLSTVYLQIFNRDTPAWETVDSDNSSAEDTDFILTANIPDLTDYKDANTVIVCRVYQQDV